MSRRRPFGAGPAVLGMLVALAGCDSEAPPPAPPGPATYASPDLPAAAASREAPPALRYVDVTAAAGIEFRHENGAYGEKLLPETMGAGCAFLDHDGDGDPDLLLLNGGHWPGRGEDGEPPRWSLYRNDGGMKFTDVTVEAGLDRPFYAMGAAAADVDGDGDPDLFVSGVGGYRFFVNESGRFREATAEFGLDPGTWTDEDGQEHGPFATSAAFFDHDGDGRPDLFVCHYVRWSVQTDVWSTMDGRTKSYAIPKQYQGESCRLWRNVDGTRFEDVTDSAGVRNDEGKSLGVCVLDVNADGLPDLAVANDTQPDYLYVNRGGGRFEDLGREYGMAYGPDGTVRAGMGIDSTVLGAEEKPVIAVGNFSGEPVSLWQLRERTFANRADRTGVAVATYSSLTFGIRFLDADLDGRMDLVLGNGHIEPTIQEVHKGFTYEQPMQLLRGISPDRFVDVSTQMGEDFTRPRVARGVAAADVDGDGDLDLCVTTCGGRPSLLRCDLENAERRSLRIRVVGRAPGTDALGARVTVEAGDRTQVQWVRTGSSYLAQSELTLTFGLGDAGRAERVTVRWPDGSEKSITDLPPGIHVVDR